MAFTLPRFTVYICYLKMTAAERNRVKRVVVARKIELKTWFHSKICWMFTSTINNYTSTANGYCEMLIITLHGATFHKLWLHSRSSGDFKLYFNALISACGQIKRNTFHRKTLENQNRTIWTCETKYKRQPVRMKSWFSKIFWEVWNISYTLLSIISSMVGLNGVFKLLWKIY